MEIYSPPSLLPCPTCLIFQASIQAGIERTAWVRDEAKLRSMIAALHQEQKKRDMHARILELLGLLEYTEEQQQCILEGLPAGWERRLPIMEPLWKSLANELDSRRQA